jgi:predicted nucleotidyltransferase
MAADTGKSAFEEIVERFQAGGVEFIVIGGQAEHLLGGARVTFDTDLCYRRDQENLEKLAGVLRELKPTLRGAPPDLPFQLDSRSLALGSNFTFDTIAGPLDLLGYVEPLGGYDEILKNAETIPVGDSLLRVISLDDLIRIKRHINRPKDRESLMHLLAIQRIRDEQAGPR